MQLSHDRGRPAQTEQLVQQMLHWDVDANDKADEPQCTPL